jgi:two-component system, OmpR family, sensor histidine kinase SenX3
MALVPPATQLSSAKRSKWFYITVGVTLIVVAVALTVGFQILGATDAGERAREVASLRWLTYFFGTLLSLLLVGGLGLLVTLLLREVRLNERQSNFVSAVTHELKTPVASLRLYLDTLQMREVTPEQRQKFYGTMRDDLDRLTVTINNVLNAAMYTDSAGFDPKPLDYGRLVERAIDLTRTRNQLPIEALRFEGPTSLGLRGEAGALETAVLNLLDNAVKYSKDNVRVDVRLWNDASGRAHLQVADQGVGMTRAHLRFIFNRFYRIGAEVRRSHTGTGLGLFIVRSVARRHKGEVLAESLGPDKGSTFTLIVPGVVADLEAAS